MFITRMPDNLKVAKTFLETPFPRDAKVIVLENAQGKKVTYRLIEAQAEYEGHDAKLAVIYSEALEDTKRNTCQKNVDKESKQIEQVLKKYGKRIFKCKADAVKEVKFLETKTLAKLKYHTVELSITEQEKKRPGRPSKNPQHDTKVLEYQLNTEIALEFSGKIVREIRNIDDRCKKIIKFLRLSESCFAWNGG